MENANRRVLEIERDTNEPCHDQVAKGARSPGAAAIKCIFRYVDRYTSTAVTSCP